MIRELSGTLASSRGPGPARNVITRRASGRYRELASSGGVKDRADQEADVAFVDPGDGLAKADGRMVGEAG
jgi:hypothetical protein